MQKSTLILGALTFVTLTIIAFLFIYWQPDKNNKTVTVRVGGLPVAQGLPFFLALEKGYFAEAGINIEYTPFENPNQLVDAILSHTIDTTHTGGPMGIASIANFKNPGKIKVYAASGGDTTSPNDSILVKSDSTIASFEDLRGKKLGVLSGIQWRTIATHILNQNNLVVDEDITLVELAPSLQIQALAQGQIDALLAIQPIPTVAQIKEIGKEIVSVPTITYVSDPFYGGAGIINTEFLQQNPEVAKKFFDVIEKSIDESEKDPESTISALQKYTGLDETIASKVPLPIVKMSSNFTKKDTDALQKFLDIFSASSVIDGEILLSPLLYNPL